MEVSGGSAELVLRLHAVLCWRQESTLGVFGIALRERVLRIYPYRARKYDFGFAQVTVAACGVVCCWCCKPSHARDRITVGIILYTYTESEAVSVDPSQSRMIGVTLSRRRAVSLHLSLVFSSGHTRG